MKQSKLVDWRMDSESCVQCHFKSPVEIWKCIKTGIKHQTEGKKGQIMTHLAFDNSYGKHSYCALYICLACLAFCRKLIQSKNTEFAQIQGNKCN